MKKLMLVSVVCSVSLCGFAATHTVTALTLHTSLNSALRVKTGDTIELPELGDGLSYKVSNVRVGTVEGNVVTIVGPGLLGIQTVDAENVLGSDIAAVLSVPDPIGDGRVFLRNPSHWDSAKWCSGEKEVWECLAGDDPTEKDYPHLPNDIAIIAFYNGWAAEVDIGEDISLGGLYIGAFSLDKDMRGYLYRIRGAEGVSPTLTFERTDGESPFIQVCPAAKSVWAVINSQEAYDNAWRVKPAFGDSSKPITVKCAGDVKIDLGWDGVKSTECLADFVFDKGCTLDISEGSSLTFVNGAPFQSGGAFTAVDAHGVLTGAGRFVNRSRAAVRPDFDGTDFTGTIVEASLGRDTYSRSANTWLEYGDKYGNAALEVDGFVHMREDNGDGHIERDWPWGKSAGYFRVGYNHTWPGCSEVGNRLPGREVILRGGYVELQNEQKTWSEGAKCRYETALLNMDAGFTFLHVNGNDNSSYPETFFAATNAVHTNTAAMVVRCNGLWKGGHCDRVQMYMPWFKDQAVGGIVPWMIGWTDQADYGQLGGWTSLQFLTVDENDFLCDPNLTGAALDDAEENSNAYVEGQNLTLSGDKTVNSLCVKKENNDERNFGANHTLTITSGGLILTGYKARIGSNAWGRNEVPSNGGTLAFGARAYVYPNSPVTNNLSWIMVPMVAPYGFTCAYPGYLAICGDQTGIDEDITVIAGELMLGLTGVNNSGADLNLSCEIDVPVRIVGGGSKLILAAGSHLDPHQNVYFEDVGGFAGKLVIPEGSVETCLKCYVDGVALPRGTYGANGSGADNIDDDHFAGGGVLKVRKDDLVRGLQIIIL